MKALCGSLNGSLYLLIDLQLITIVFIPQMMLKGYIYMRCRYAVSFQDGLSLKENA